MFISRPAVNDIEKQLPLPHMLMTDRERHLPPPPRPSPVMRPRSCAEIVVGNEPIPKALENWINHDSYALTLPIRDTFYLYIYKSRKYGTYISFSLFCLIKDRKCFYLILFFMKFS